jgi:hypothetical protein
MKVTKRMRVLVLFTLALAFAAAPALAQTAVRCNTAGVSNPYCEQVPCSGGACTRSTTPTASEFTTAVAFYPNGKGLPLAGMQGAWLQVCAASGETLTGTGTVRLWTWTAWNSSVVSTSQEVVLNVADVWVAGACGGSDCRCVHWADWQVAGGSGRKVIAEAVAVGTSAAGVSTLDVRFLGLERLK